MCSKKNLLVKNYLIDLAPLSCIYSSICNIKANIFFKYGSKLIFFLLCPMVKNVHVQRYQYQRLFHTTFESHLLHVTHSNGVVIFQPEEIISVVKPFLAITSSSSMGSSGFFCSMIFTLEFQSFKLNQS